MSSYDWLVVGSYILVSVFIGLFFSKRAGRNLDEYFLSGRSLPWWILGSSMVATTFASDTPLAITEYVRQEGIWRNWFWWTLAISHVLAAVVFARLWRRAGVLTDNELIEIRYGGKPAAFLRAFKAGYFSTIYNFVVLAWVTAAMSTVLSSFVEIPMWIAVVSCMSIALVYSLFGGFWGVVFTDLFQFVIAMAGSVIFAILASSHYGGMQRLIEKVTQMGHGNVLSFFPGPDAPMSFWYTFLVFIGILWWSNHNADGGGYIIQRMMSAKDEKNALIGTFWFALAHYVLRMWPWIVVALASMVMFPALGHVISNDKQAYPAVMSAILPTGLRGLFVAVFLAAFMSTVDTHLNWGSSYIVNDIYRRFIKKHASQKHLVIVSRLTMLILGILSAIVAMFIKSITGAWEFVWAMGAGVGAVLILRWFWWRINAWSEISALGTSLVVAIGIWFYELVTDYSVPFYIKALIVVGSSLSVWIPVTFFTRPEKESVLKRFQQRVTPPGHWPSDSVEKKGDWSILFSWIGGVGLIYGLMFSVGSLVLLQYEHLVWSIPISLLGILIFWRGIFSGEKSG